MIPKPVNEIGLDDLQALIDGEVAENKTLEYTREMPGGGNPIPFLAAVSAFANTSGGDLLIGVEAVEGVPQALPGVEVASVDQETLRLTGGARSHPRGELRLYGPRRAVTESFLPPVQSCPARRV